MELTFENYSAAKLLHHPKAIVGFLVVENAIAVLFNFILWR